MMEISFLVQGFLLGLTIAAPVGPIGVLCIRRSLYEGLPAGFISGLGAATADALYGAVAGFGLTLVSRLLVNMGFFLQFLGGVLLCLVGIKALKASASLAESNNKAISFKDAYLETLFLTLTNPATIISFIGVYAGLGLGSKAETYGSAAALTLGVFLGSASWWLLLSSVTSLLRVRITSPVKLAIDKVSGVILVLFGIFAFLRAFSVI
jgi:threonine/homoserine/homoserine lactone efflux protein